jgi:hypothetical protein
MTVASLAIYLMEEEEAFNLSELQMFGRMLEVMCCYCGLRSCRVLVFTNGEACVLLLYWPAAESFPFL